jgi:hypothetical protein
LVLIGFVAVSASLVLAPSIAPAQAIYRCGSTFSQSPCGSGQVQLKVAPTPSASTTPGGALAAVKQGAAFKKLKDDLIVRRRQGPPAGDVVRANIKACDAGIRGAMKDPEGARVKDVTRVGPSIDANGGLDALVAGVDYSAIVNGRNSYGGYTGEKPWICVFDTTEATIIRVKKVGQGYLTRPWFDE